MRLAYLVLALSLVPAALVYFRVRTSVAGREHLLFKRLVAQRQLAIKESASRSLDEMQGVRGLFSADGQVSAMQWNRYTENLASNAPNSAIDSIGYLMLVNTGEESKFTKLTDGTHPATIHPEGSRQVYFPFLFVTSLSHGSPADVGRDDYADPVLRQVMDSAWESGMPEAAGEGTLRKSQAAIGTRHQFKVYLPVYIPGASTASREDRQENIKGFIFASIDSRKLLNASEENKEEPLLRCELFDGGEGPASSAIRRGTGPAAEPASLNRTLALSTNITLFNRTWTLHFQALPEFESLSQRNLPTVALVVWLTMGLLLYGIARSEVQARARAEEMAGVLRKSEAALAVEKERLAVTLYSIADGVITTDVSGLVLSMNKSAERLTGWSQPESLNKPLPDLFATVQGTEREPCPNPVAGVLTKGETDTREQPVLLIARNGAERVVTHSAAPIRGRDGAIIGAVLVFRDITARQKSEAELLKESKLESVGLLAGGIAHDFNNILQGILGNLSLARMNAHSTEKMLERLERVEKSTMRARELTQQLVMFARGGAPIRKQMQANNLIKDATLFALHGSNVHCEFSLPADIWPVEIDEGQFRQVINNIVLNAVQAMPEGGKIEVRCENVEFSAGVLPPMKAGKYVKIAIRDFGTGIRPEHLPRIFDPYFSTHSHGRGLGLASVHSVVRKHEGQITVESQVGRGSTFQIYLPASVRPLEMPPESALQKQMFGQGRVLVMDDEVVILELAAEMLKSIGFEVETAKEGEEGIDKYVAARAAGHPYSVVVMDLTVPEGMGGKEMIRRLREIDPQVKAIVSSGYSLDPVMANFREYGFSGVIPKPYVMDDLGRLISEVIAGKPANAGPGEGRQ